MLPDLRIWTGALGIALGACSGAQGSALFHSDASAGDDGGADASSDGRAGATQCTHDPSLDQTGPGACSVGPTLLQCFSPSGLICECVADSGTCDCPAGSSCNSKCAANQYAVGCGGPTPGVAYQTAPGSCAFSATTSVGTIFSCCPCQ